MRSNDVQKRSHSSGDHQRIHVSHHNQSQSVWFQPPKCSPHKFSTLFQHISAVAAVNIVTVLSRSVAFSFHLKRSVTLKKCWTGVCGQGSAPDPAGGAHDAPPNPLVNWKVDPRDAFRGQSRSPNTVSFHMSGILSSCAIVTFLIPTPLYAFGVSIWRLRHLILLNPPFFLLVGRQLFRTDWITYAVCTTIMGSFFPIVESTF